MKWSIVIPVLNEETIIVDKLRTIKEKLHQDMEVIVVDGGSLDETKSLAGTVISKVIDSNPGRASQMNRGAGIANGRWLLFLHIDTDLPNNFPDCLKHVSLETDDDAWGRFDVCFNHSGIIYSIIAFMMNLRSRLTSVATGDQALFIKKTTFEKVGGFPEIELMEDVAISKQLRNLISPICLQDKVITSSRRWEEKGPIRTILLMWFLRLAYFIGVNPNKLKKLYA